MKCLTYQRYCFDQFLLLFKSHFFIFKNWIRFQLNSTMTIRIAIKIFSVWMRLFNHSHSIVMMHTVNAFYVLIKHFSKELGSGLTELEFSWYQKRKSTFLNLFDSFYFAGWFLCKQSMPGRSWVPWSWKWFLMWMSWR